MGANLVFKTLSGLVTVAIILMVIVEMNASLSWRTLPGDLKRLFSEMDSDEPDRHAAPPPSNVELRTDHKAASENEAGDDSLLANPTLGNRLVVGVMGATPAIDQIHWIAEVPWDDPQVIRAFNQSKDFACHSLLPDEVVKSPLNRLSKGRRGVMGRTAAVTVGLEIDGTADLKLPAASANAIRRYLSDHRLAIQPIVFQDENGRAYFGTDCRAAFYAIAFPTLTIKAEPLIDEAINNFRALGVLRESDEPDGRTLVMAFRYVDLSQKDDLIAAKPKSVIELLFLHIVQPSHDKAPQFEVFATSNSRQDLHRLVTDNDMVRRDSQPTISASIRFDDFVLMGLYPAKPVVTGVKLRSGGVVSIDTVKRLTQQNRGDDQLTFQDFLDQFSTISEGL